MENPSSYGGVVGNGAFCNRAQELADLQQMMLSAARCFVYAERRMGKTSLIQQAMRTLPNRQCTAVQAN